MGIFGKKNKDRGIMLKYIDGIEAYTKDLTVEAILKEDLLEIKGKNISNIPTIKLPYEQILAANCVTEKEIVQANKSVVGRALVGGVLLGSLGAIIGGASGIGNKNKDEISYYIVINYKSQIGDLKVISFQIVGFTNWNKFIRELKGKIKNQQIEDNTEIYL